MNQITCRLNKIKYINYKHNGTRARGGGGGGGVALESNKRSLS